MGQINGLTISHWNGRSDFQTLANIGVKFVIAKCSEGTTYRDDTYQMNHTEFNRVGVKVGAYHFYRPQNGSLQADLMLSCLHGFKPDVWMIDVEEQYRNPREEIKNIETFIRRVQAELKSWPIWYSSRNFMKQFEKAGIEPFAALPLMVAEWNYKIPVMPYPWFVHTMYQQWANQKIPGLIGSAEFCSCTCSWDELMEQCNQPHLLP